MRLTGAEIVAEVLLDHGVNTVFGYPGGAALNIYDQLYKYRDKIRHVMTAHEQGASHAADGYARATGKTGVVFSTSGPGATNLVTGLATAFMDSIPMVAITANVPDSLIGKDSFQEICITGVTIPVTKHNFFVNRIEDLEESLRKAFQIAGSGRKGPVLVDITKDVTAAVTDFENKEPLPLRANPEMNRDDIHAIVKLINQAEKPLIYAGGGVIASNACSEVRELVEKADIPITHTLMAAGIVGWENEHNLGMIGMHGSVASNRAVDQADLVIALGARFDDRVALNPQKWARKAKIVHVDIDKSEINKNVKVDRYCVGDVKEFLQRALPYIEERKHEKWHERVAAWKEKDREQRGPEGSVNPKEALEIISDAVDDEAIYVTDVGQHQMWAAQFLKHKKAFKFLTSGGLGTMGYGYGAAIGAKLGRPKDRVIHITGDGSFHMNLNEAATAVSERLPIITVIMNNRVLGMVYQWQTIFYENRYSSTIPERKTDFVKLAEGFGAKGFRAGTAEELKKVMEIALKEEGPVWIDLDVSKEERVLPMIPGGGSVDDMIID